MEKVTRKDLNRGKVTTEWQMRCLRRQKGFKLVKRLQEHLLFECHTVLIDSVTVQRHPFFPCGFILQCVKDASKYHRDSFMDMLLDMFESSNPRLLQRKRQQTSCQVDVNIQETPSYALYAELGLRPDSEDFIFLPVLLLLAWTGCFQLPCNTEQPRSISL